MFCSPNTFCRRKVSFRGFTASRKTAVNYLKPAVGLIQKKCDVGVWQQQKRALRALLNIHSRVVCLRLNDNLVLHTCILQCSYCYDKKLIRRWETRTWHTYEIDYRLRWVHGPPSLYCATPLAFNAPTGGFPWDDLRKILHGGQRMVTV